MLLKSHAIDARKFPFPYRAALAICSDIDECDLKTFVDVHRFLNKDLGLPVADSFFGQGKVEGQLAYFSESGQESPEAPFIRQAIHAGLIDSLHSWGDFNQNFPEPKKLRKMATRLTDSLLAKNLKINIWINHGDPCNLQNLKTRTRPEFQGDDPASPYYTGDLLKDLGLKYYWSNELVKWPLSGNWRTRGPGGTFRLLINQGKNLIKRVLKQEGLIKTREQLLELATPVEIRSGARLMAFNRFYWDLNESPPATRRSLHRSLKPKVFKDLLKQEGFLILYTHLGRPRQPGQLFPAPDRQALESLARFYRSGLIWVARTIDILNYWMLRRYLRWTVLEEDGRVVIDLISLDDPLTGPRPPNSKELAGLCFHTPWPEKTTIRLAGQELKSKIFKSDHEGRASIGFSPPPPPRIDFLG